MENNIPNHYQVRKLEMPPPITDRLIECTMGPGLSCPLMQMMQYNSAVATAKRKETATTYANFRHLVENDPDGLQREVVRLASINPTAKGRGNMSFEMLTLVLADHKRQNRQPL